MSWLHGHTEKDHAAIRNGASKQTRRIGTILPGQKRCLGVLPRRQSSCQSGLPGHRNEREKPPWGG